MALVQQFVDLLRQRTEREIQMQNQYGVDVKDWPEAVKDEYDWPDVEEALIKLVAVLFAWNDKENWITADMIDEYGCKREEARRLHG